MEPTNPEMTQTAQALVAPGKGILAADESFPTIEKRLKSVGVERRGSVRRDDRPVGLGRDPARRVPGGTRNHPRHQGGQGREGVRRLPGEKVAEGTDGLRERLSEYHDLGARFTKWRAPLAIGPGVLTETCIRTNAVELARFCSPLPRG